MIHISTNIDDEEEVEGDRYRDRDYGRTLVSTTRPSGTFRARQSSAYRTSEREPFFSPTKTKAVLESGDVISLKEHIQDSARMYAELEKRVNFGI